MRLPRSRALVLLLAVGCVAIGVVAAAHIAGTGPVEGPGPIDAPNGPTVTVTGSTNAWLEQPPSAGTVPLVTEAGNITFSSSGSSDAEIAFSDILGTTTAVTAIDAANNDLTIDPADKQSVTVGGELRSITWRATTDMGVDDGNTDFSYTVANGQTGELSIGGAPANTLIIAADSATQTILGSDTSDGSGTLSFTSLNDGTHDVELQTYSPSPPSIDNPSPTGDLASEPSQLEIDVDDADFSRGDTVTVEFKLDGSVISTQTVGAAQTVSASIPASGKLGGQHDWSVTATDSFGESTIDQFSYQIPNTLYIRDENDHDDLIDSPITINGTFFGSEQIFSRPRVTDGTINMTGLPVGEVFIAQAQPSDDNWTTRTAYINSIYEQESIYLLNTSRVVTVDSRFKLNDPTGQYGANSVLYLQKPINISGNVSWQTVHADYFGVEGVTATLEQGQLYRIKVSNAQGDSQIVGPYRADVSETVTVQPGTPTIPIGEFTNGWAANAELDNDTITYRYSDPQNETDRLIVWVHQQGDPTNSPAQNDTFFDLGDASGKITLAPSEKNKTWVVKFIVDRGSEDFTRAIVVSNRNDLFASLGPNWRTIMGVGGLILLGGAFSMLNAAIGAVIVSLIGGLFWWVGLLGAATSGIGVIIAIFIAVLNHIRTRGGP